MFERMPVKEPSAAEKIDRGLVEAETKLQIGLQILQGFEDMIGKHGDYMVDERYASYYGNRNYALSLIDRLDTRIAALKALKKSLHDAEAEA